MGKKFKRIFVIVMDSAGVGEAHDAKAYGDFGANTFNHLSYAKKDFNIPTLQKLGIGNITDINNTPKTDAPLASWGRMQELSVGKDTLTGHWEMMGLEVEVPFPAFTDTGFPKELLDELSEQTGYPIIGNCAASGTEIIKELGEQQIKEKALIVYTSSDSVLQIAAHEDVFPVPELYRCCEIARKITLSRKEWMVGRVIARPYIGEDKDHFVRTSRRHDYAVSPSGKTVLETLKENDYDVIAVGKINDIFNGVGITETTKTKNNEDGMNVTINIAKKDFEGLCFVNLVDFDSSFGHRRDPMGYAKCVEEFDGKFKELMNDLTDDDLVIITADHGNDPTWTGTDHTRENVPLIAYAPGVKDTVNLGLRDTFADLAATIADNFNIEAPLIGTSFLDKLKK